MSGAIEYAQARMQSRHGARPDARTWANVHAAITPAALLEAARASALEPWIAGLDASTPAHELELALRERLRARICEVARWMPEEWRPALLWTRALVDLPALQHLARGRPAPGWMTRDPAIATRLDDAGDEERARRARGAWTEAWRRAWPPGGEDERSALEALARLVEAHLEAFARADPADAPAMREQLGARVQALFRRHALSPAAAFCHVLLAALECERIRAELVARAPEPA